MNELNSKWTRATRTSSAMRGDRVSLVLTDTGWTAIRGQQTHSVPAPPIAESLESAIAATDHLLPPTGWEAVAGNWEREGWTVKAEDQGWYIYRAINGSHEPASVREFASADRARRWVEVRLDRTGTNLRGPKPRAGRKSNCKLPDVRVTEAEKTNAMAILESLGLSYSQFVRASLRFASEHLSADPADDTGWVVEKAGGKTSFVSRAGDICIMQAKTSGSERSEELLVGGS